MKPRPTLAVLIPLVLTAAACTGSDTSAKPSNKTCNTVNDGSLPTWARGGFTPPDQKIAHVVGARGDIAGILFGDPLSSPRAGGGSNKILWVSRPQLSTPGDLKIHASLEGTSTVADRTVEGGPGPSTLDLPKAGCWIVDLRWPGHTDTVRLKYAKG